MKRPAFLAALAVLAAPPAAAQQFQQVGSGVPGPVVWTEGVETFDADGDGWLDVLFANGIGFASAGGALAPTLLMNDTTTGGAITFLDETGTRLPAGLTLQAKAVAACDVDLDGDPDVVFANAFQNQPVLLINDGTGHFANETATRLPALLLNSFGLSCGDVDADGDLDLVLADAGPSAFGGTGGKARLLLNDGSGRFTDSPGRLNAVNKVGSQNAQLHDVDNDFDLDVIVDGKSSGQQLYVNDGSGQFALQAALLPGGSSNTYATDWADLDNDHDLDGFYLSFSGFNEGTARNSLVPDGSLAFAGTTTTLAGLNGHDDNDLVFLDADDDGRLDVIVGSLGNNREKLYLNAGTFADGSFVYQAAGFSAQTDSTLDLCVGDFDRDGRYDIATAQGESGGFTNRVYRNTGPADSHAPVIGRVEPVPALVPLARIQAGGLVRRAWIRDATVKRGWTFVGARLDVSAVKDGVTQTFSVPMRQVGGGIHRGAIAPAPSPTGTVGMQVTSSVHASDPSANASDSPAAEFRICGAEAYGTPVVNSSGQLARIAGVNDPSVAANAFSLAVSGLPPNRPASLFYGTQKLAAGVPLGSGLRFVGGVLRRAGFVIASAAGTASLNLDFSQPPLSELQPGDTRYFQLQYQDPTAQNLNGSDALEVVVCN